jgi:hypothetical protein
MRTAARQVRVSGKTTCSFMKSGNNKTTDALVMFYIFIFVWDRIYALMTCRLIKEVICLLRSGFGLSF